jgi:hypothetical protein
MNDRTAIKDVNMKRNTITRDQWTLVGVIIALTVAGALYRVFMANGLAQSSALFIGLPAILAIILTLTPRATSATGVIMKSTTVALLMSGAIFGEGFLCILMSAPLFYLVGAAIGLIVDYQRRKDKSPTLPIVVIVPILLSSLEGTTPALTFPRQEEIRVTKVVNGSPADVEHALAQQPVFDKTLPAFIRKYPRPVRSSGEGLTVGSVRRMHFVGGEGSPGDLTMRVTKREPSSVTFTAESDTSHIRHWLTWRESHVAWRAAGAGRTEVTWTLRYDRELDPAWYFGPFERYATRLATEYLVDTLATPQ